MPLKEVNADLKVAQAEEVGMKSYQHMNLSQKVLWSSLNNQKSGFDTN